jgi:sorbitol-specific phosphotransferase system component IIC
MLGAGGHIVQEVPVGILGTLLSLIAATVWMWNFIHKKRKHRVLAKERRIHRVAAHHVDLGVLYIV